MMEKKKPCRSHTGTCLPGGKTDKKRTADTGKHKTAAMSEYDIAKNRNIHTYNYI